jgi:hypothetical protein
MADREGGVRNEEKLGFPAHIAALHEVHVHTLELVIELDEPKHWGMTSLHKKKIKTREIKL